MTDLEALSEYIVTHNKTHLIFDFDGTLAYLDIPWKQWGKDIREELLALDAELWKKYQYPGVGTVQNEIVENYGKPALELLINHSIAFEQKYRDKIVRNDPLLKQVEAFRDTYHLSIWSSNTRDLITYVLEQTGMSDWFEKMATRNDVRFVKPSGEGFEFLRDPDVPKERYVLIGDSSHDRNAAAAAGIDSQIIDFFKLGR